MLYHVPLSAMGGKKTLNRVIRGSDVTGLRSFGRSDESDRYRDRAHRFARFGSPEGLADDEYFERTGDQAPVGQRLSLTSNGVEHCLFAVRKAIVAISTTADKECGLVATPAP